MFKKIAFALTGAWLVWYIYQIIRCEIAYRKLQKTISRMK